MNSDNTKKAPKNQPGTFRRIPRALHWLNHQGQILRERGLRTRVHQIGQRLGKTLAQQTLGWLHQHPQWQAHGIALSRKLGLHALLRQRLYHLLQQRDPAQTPENTQFFTPDSLSGLSLSGRRIHALLAKPATTHEKMSQE